MTVCIAAICDNGNAIVTCADRRVGVGFEGWFGNRPQRPRCAVDQPAVSSSMLRAPRPGTRELAWQVVTPRRFSARKTLRLPEVIREWT